MKPIFLSFALLFAPCVALAESEQDWKICNVENADAAIPACTRLIATEKLDAKDHSAALSGRATAYWRKHDYDRALADADRAIKLNSKNSDAYVRRGAVYLGKGDFERAIADESKAIDIDPRNFKAYSNRGLLYTIQRDYDRAIADATKAIEINPKFPNPYSVRGNAYQAKGDQDLAIADLTMAIEIDPNFVYAYSNRASAYARKHNYEQAIADYSKALEIDPAFASGYEGRGTAYEHRGDLDRAIVDYAKYVEINPTSFYCMRSLGIVRFMTGDFQGASADLSRALELRKDVYPLLFRYFARRRIGEAAEAELQENQLALKNSPWPFAFTQLYLGKRSPEFFLAAAVKRSDRCLAQFYIGEWYGLNQNTSEAAVMFNAATEICDKESLEYRAAVAALTRLKP